MDVPPPIPNLNAAILAAAQILEYHINAPIAPAFSDESDDDNSDSGDEDLPIMLDTEEEERVRNKHYVVNVVYYMSDLDFRRHFRLSRSGVEVKRRCFNRFPSVKRQHKNLYRLPQVTLHCT